MYVIVYDDCSDDGKLTNYAYYKSLAQAQAVIDKWIIDNKYIEEMYRIETYRIETLRPGDRA